jgi:hypothetical protein
MSDDDRLFDFEVTERLMDELSLSGRCPTLRPWPVCVTEARAIDGDDAISLGQPFEYPANLKILHHGAVTVQQEEGRSLASLEVVEPDPFYIKEATDGWVVPLRLTCASSDDQSRGS